MADENKTTMNETLGPEVLEQIKAELREELKVEMATKMVATQSKSKRGRASGETKAQIEHSNEKVPYILPIIEGEPEEVNVTVNGKTLQILRGEQVEIPRMYAEVLDNQTAQARFFRKFQKEKKSQITEVGE